MYITVYWADNWFRYPGCVVAFERQMIMAWWGINSMKVIWTMYSCRHLPVHVLLHCEDPLWPEVEKQAVSGHEWEHLLVQVRLLERAPHQAGHEISALALSQYLAWFHHWWIWHQIQGLPLEFSWLHRRHLVPFFWKVENNKHAKFYTCIYVHLYTVGDSV